MEDIKKQIKCATDWVLHKQVPAYVVVLLVVIWILV
jgi:hypothetical protein